MRELLVVLGLASAGLLLAALAAFAPWYPVRKSVGLPVVVELRCPAGHGVDPGFTAAGHRR